RRAAQAAAAEKPAPAAPAKKTRPVAAAGPTKARTSIFANGRRAILIAITAFLLIFTALRYFDGYLPALGPFGGKSSPVREIPTAPKIETPIQNPDKSSARPEPATPSIATTPNTPAALPVAAEPAPSLIAPVPTGVTVSDPDTTGS